MSNLPIGGLGSNTGLGNLPIYGYGITSTPQMDIMSGSTKGGDPYTIAGSGIGPSGFIDTFSGPSLNTDAWNNASSGGSLSFSDGLVLGVPTTGGLAKIASTAFSAGFDATISYSYNGDIEDLFPTTQLKYCEVALTIDSNNYITLTHGWTPGVGSIVEFTVVADGTIQYVTSVPASSAARILRIVRFEGRVQAWVGATVITDYTGWSKSASVLSIACSCNSSPRPLATTISKFTPVPLVVFGGIFAPQPIQTRFTIAGVTPAVSIPGKVPINVYMYGLQGLLLGTQFEFVSPLKLTISEGNSVGTIIIDNDDTLRDTSNTLKGLRL
jgi:hypothetical protein